MREVAGTFNTIDAPRNTLRNEISQLPERLGSLVAALEAIEERLFQPRPRPAAATRDSGDRPDYIATIEASVDATGNLISVAAKKAEEILNRL